MQLEIACLPQPQQCRQVVADHVVPVARMLLGKQPFAYHVRRQCRLHVLLKEVLTGQPGRIPIQGERSIAEVVEQKVRVAHEIREKIAFGQGRRRACCGPEDPCGMGDRHADIADLQVTKARVAELIQERLHPRLRASAGPTDQFAEAVIRFVFVEKSEIILLEASEPFVPVDAFQIVLTAVAREVDSQ